MQLAYFDLDDLKAAIEAGVGLMLLLAALAGFLGYAAAQLCHCVIRAVDAMLRRRGSAAPFDWRVRAAKDRHVLVARMLQARINREERRVARAVGERVEL